MSTWRDIWKKSIKANRLYSLDENMGNDYFAYFFIWGFVWLVPTIIICGIYYYIQSRKAVK